MAIHAPEEYGNIQDAETAHEQHGGGKTLNQELDRKGHAVKIVVDTEQGKRGMRAAGW